MELSDIGFISLIAGGLGWYLKHRIKESSAQQLERFKEEIKISNTHNLERLKSDLGWNQEVSKIRFSSIYERKINALLDSYAHVQKYEISIKTQIFITIRKSYLPGEHSLRWGRMIGSCLCD